MSKFKIEVEALPVSSSGKYLVCSKYFDLLERGEEAYGEFKPGDMVRISMNPSHPHDAPSFVGSMDGMKGKMVRLECKNPGNGWWSIEGSGFSWAERWFERVAGGSSGSEELKAVIKPKSMIRTLTNMMKKLLDSDTQTLAKAEYINGDLELTSRGRDALLTILFVTNKAELVKMAQEDIDEIEKKNK